MKRLLAMLLAVLIVISLCVPLAGCSSNAAELKMGSWLTMMADSFGMAEYRTEKPYFAKVGSEDPAFGVFQMAVDWEILEPSDTMTSDKAVTWREALITLVNCGRFIDMDASEQEKIDFAIANFGTEIRSYWMDRSIPLSRAVELLDKAADKWANKTFPETVEKVELKDDVLNLLEENVEYEVFGNMVKLDANLVKDLKAGDYYALPGISGQTEGSINKVASVDIVDGVAVITNEEELSDEEILSKIISADDMGSQPVDFGNIVAIYDNQGRQIYSADTGVDTNLVSIGESEYDSVRVTTLENKSGPGMTATNTDGDFFKKLLGKPIELDLGDGLKGKLSFTSNSATLELSRTRSKDSKYRSMVEKTYFETKISDVKLNKDVDISGSKVKSAYMTLDYKTTFTAGMKYSEVNHVGTQLQPGQEKRTHLSTIVSGYANAIGNLKKQVYETKYSNKSIYICRFTVAGGPMAGVDFIMKGKITASGTVELSLTMAGTRGIEYVNGNLRTVKSTDPSVSAKMEGNFEITMVVGFEARILKTAVGSASIEAGVGASVSSTAHLIDAEWHKLYSGEASMGIDDANDMMEIEYQTTSEDILAAAEAEGATWNGYTPDATVMLGSRICVDWSLYPLFSISGRIDALDKGLTKTILDSDDVILTGHIDFPNNVAEALAADGVAEGFKAALGVGKKCGYEFKPWDGQTEETTEATDVADGERETVADDEAIMISDAVQLSAQRVFLDTNQSGHISVVALPKGYSLSDLVVECEQNAVTVNLANGTVTAGELAGSFTVTVKTSDGKYSAVFAVTVYEPIVDDFEALII